MPAAAAAAVLLGLVAAVHAAALAAFSGPLRPSGSRPEAIDRIELDPEAALQLQGAGVRPV